MKILSLMLCCSLLCGQLYAAPKQALLIFTSEMPEIDTDKGDYPQLATLLQQYRAGTSPAFFLFGGASLGPSMLSAFDYGSHIIDILNTLEPDVMAVANREFSYFEDELSLRAYEAAFPVVASNLWDPITNDNLEGLSRHVILQQGNFRLGVIAVVAPDIAEQYALQRVTITEPEQAIREQAALLRQQGVDAIALLYSSQFPALKNWLAEGIIDLSLSKDDHFLLTHAEAVSAHSHDIFLPKPGLAAIVKLQKSPGQPLQLETETVSLTQYAKAPAVQQQIKDYTLRLNKLLDHPLGTTATALDTRRRMVRTQENAFANFVADTIRQSTGADIVLLNSGSFRGEQLYAPDLTITRRHIAREFPFKNSVAVLTITGQQLWDALESGLSQYESIRGRFPQVSGMRVRFNSEKPVGKRLLSVEIHRQPLQLEKHYKLATLDYLANGGDGYTSLKAASEHRNTDYTVNWLLSDIIIAGIQKHTPISPAIDGRIQNMTGEE